MPTVSLPDGTDVDFPDGTDPGVMRDAMRKHWWKHNDAIMAKDKAAAAPSLPKQGEEYSAAGTGKKGMSVTTPYGRVTLPTGEDVSNFIAGAGKRADQAMDRGGQILSGNDPAVNRGMTTIRAEKDRLNAPLMDTKAGKAGEIATDVAATALPAAKVVRGAAAFASPLARTVASVAGAGSLAGLYDAGTKPVVGDETTAGNAMEGFGWGAGGQLAGNAVGKVIKGVVPAVKKAMDPITGRVKEAYDRATLGQIADKDTITGRITNMTEEGSGSLPLVGAAIRNKRQKGVDHWRETIMNENGAPDVALRKGSTGQRIEGTQQDFNTGYDDALAGHQISPDAQFRAKIFQRALDPSNGLPPDVRTTLAKNVDEQYVDLFRPGSVGPNGPMPPVADAAALKAMESRLSKQSRQRGMSQTPDGPALAELTRDIRDDLRRSYRSQLPMSTARDLGQLDRAYAPFKTVERAATYTGNQEGNFTPPQLLQAVKARTRPDEFAARKGMLQEEADTGKQVFQNRMGDTGTADRALIGLASAGAAAWHPEAAIIPAAAWAGTTKSGRNFGIGATRAQLLLKKLRADELARNSGVGLSQSVEDLLEQ